jgi:hypothetical protein
MASRYSLTIQVANPSFADKSPGGHLATVINTPSGQTYAGFGPRNGWPLDSGKFDSYTVKPGEIPPRDYSNVFGHSSNATFTIPISEAQAAAASAEIKRIKQTDPYYILGYNMCSTITNQLMQAAGLGNNLFVNPSKDFQSLTEIAKTLALDPKAQFTRDGLFIPEAFRGLQQDYAHVGSGYDTPSEGIRNVVSSRDGSFETSTPPGVPNPDTYPQLRRVGSAFPRTTPPSYSDQPTPPAEPAPMHGIFSGTPMLPSPLPPSIFGLPDNSDASGNGDFLNFLTGIASWNPTPPAPQTAGNKEAPYLSRGIVNQSQGSVFDAGAPALPPDPSDGPNFSVGLLGRLVAMAGIAPQNPTQPAPPPLDDQLLGFYRDDPVQPWTLQRRR